MHIFVMSWHVIRSATTRKHHGSYNTQPRDPARELFQYPHIRNMVSSSTIRATSGSVVSSLQHPRKRPDRLSSYWLSIPFTIRANGQIDYQVIGCRFPPSPSAQTVGSVQSLITGWMVSCQTTPNRCSQFGDDHTGCHLDQHLPRSRG